MAPSDRSDEPEGPGSVADPDGGADVGEQDAPARDRTERALRTLLAEGEREAAADARRAERWDRRAALDGLDLGAALAGAARAQAPVDVHLRGGRQIRSATVLATAADHAVVRDGDRLVLVAHHAITLVRAPAAGRLALEGVPPLVLEAELRLALRLDALAPLRVVLDLADGDRRSGRLVGVGDGVAMLESAAGVELVAIDAVDAVGLEGPGAAAQSSASPLSPLPTTSG